MFNYDNSDFINLFLKTNISIIITLWRLLDNDTKTSYGSGIFNCLCDGLFNYLFNCLVNYSLRDSILIITFSLLRHRVFEYEHVRVLSIHCSCVLNERLISLASFNSTGNMRVEINLLSSLRCSQLNTIANC